MADTGTICDLIERNQPLSLDRPERLHTESRKLHWSDILVAAIGLALLLAVSMHASPTSSRPDIQPIALKSVQDI